MTDTRFIIDTDAGVDDAQALMMALAQPAVVIEAITTVTGNIDVDQVNRNVLTVLEAMQCDVPIYQGADRPLVSEWHWETEDFHGKDGLGDWPDRPSPRGAIQTEHGVQTLLRLANEHPGELTLVVLGPMTNLALAVRLDPDLPSKIKQLVFMGGTTSARGNTRIPTAEFNMYCDPEAAYIVLNTFPESTMISWEATLTHPLTWPQYQELIHMPGPRATFFEGITHNLAAWASAQKVNPTYLLPDPLAMAIALCPELVKDSEFHRMTVELHGTHTRGQTFIDYANEHRQPPNVHVVTEIDMDGVFDLYRQMLQTPGGSSA